MEAASNRRAKINDRQRDCVAILGTEPGLQTHSWLFPPDALVNLGMDQPACNLEHWKTPFSVAVYICQGSVPIAKNVPQ